VAVKGLGCAGRRIRKAQPGDSDEKCRNPEADKKLANRRPIVTGVAAHFQCVRRVKMSKKSMKPVVTAIGAAFAGSMMLSGAAAAGSNPFGMTELNAGYAQIASNHMEGKCGGAKPAAAEGKCGAGKCGGAAPAATEGKCGGAKPAAAEGKCGAGKCGGAAPAATEGKCGGAKPAATEGKCGAGKCGANK